MTNDLLEAIKNQMALLGVDVAGYGFSEARVIEIVDAALVECAGARGLLKGAPGAVRLSAWTATGSDLDRFGKRLPGETDDVMRTRLLSTKIHL